MPKLRKGSLSLGRKTTVARKTQQRRQRESQESKERRRLQNRVSVSSARRRESPESRERRLQRDREAIAATRRRKSSAKQALCCDQDRRQTTSLRVQRRKQLCPRHYKAPTSESIRSGDQGVAYSYVGPLINADGTAMYMLQTI